MVAAFKRLGLRRTMANADRTVASAMCVLPLHRQDLAIATLASLLSQAGVDGDTLIEVL